MKNLSGLLSNRKLVMGSILIITTVIFISFSVLFKSERISASTNDDKYFTNFSVEEGDTLWSVANEYMDENHYRTVYEYIDELKEMNNLTSDEIYAGQNLIVTYYK